MWVGKEHKTGDLMPQPALGKKENCALGMHGVWDGTRLFGIDTWLNQQVLNAEELFWFILG